MTWQELFKQLNDESTDLRQVDDETYAKLLALTAGGNRPRIKARDLYSPPPAVEESERQFRWLINLLNYNLQLRSLRAKSPPPPPPTMSDDAFVPASSIQKVLSERFESLTQLNAYLAKRPGIRTHKPSSQRLEVHAGDFLRQLAADYESGFENFDAFQRDIEKKKAVRKTPRTAPGRDAK